MRRGICVKCGAATVKAANHGIQMGQSSEAHLRPNIGPGFKGMVVPQATALWSFGCTSCGYVELYVLDPAGIAFIDQTWESVPPEGGDSPSA